MLGKKVQVESSEKRITVSDANIREITRRNWRIYWNNIRNNGISDMFIDHKSYNSGDMW